MKSILRSPAIPVVLFILAAVLVAFGTVGAVQAAPRIESKDYRAEVVLTNIETALTENGKVVEGNDTLLLESWATNEDNVKLGLGWADGKVTGFAVGKKYKESLAVRNVGTIDEYVRVTVNKYWCDENGNPETASNRPGKKIKLSPKLIELHFVETGGWKIDEAASTDERTVLYYAKPIAPGEDTTPFTDTIRIDNKVLTAMAADGKLAYDGMEFRIKASVDAVQTHNAKAAMTSAWGRTV